jgi:hypothetical protein
LFADRLSASRLHVLVPALLAALFAFHAGGFFPGVTGVVAAGLACCLAVRLTIARNPVAGWSAALSVAAGGLTLFAAWTLLSGTWSDAPARALIEFDRALAYLLVVVLAGCFAVRSGDLDRVLRWTLLAFAAVCAAAVLTRLLPEQLPTRPGPVNERLSFPLTYWNALGLLAAIGLVLGLHQTASGLRPAAVRVAAAAALPVMAVTLYLTFSRGPIAIALVALPAYMLVAHPRGLLAALPAAGIPTAIAVWVAYDADALADPDVAAAAATGQPARVLLVLCAAVAAAAGLRWLALPLDRRLAGVELAPARRRRWLAAIWAAAALVLLVGAVALDAPRRISDQREAFVSGNVLPATGDLRDRLSQAGNNGRLAYWRIDRDAFEDEPLRGIGAGTYQLRWEQDRPRPPVQIRDGHSLYLEVAGELGVPGLVFLLTGLGTLLLGGLRRAWREDRHAATAFLVAGLGLLVHAGVDWDWEMPVLWIWFLGAGAVTLARREDEALKWAPGSLSRLVAGLACLLLALTPAGVALSQARLDHGVRAFDRGDCATAADAALDSLDVLGNRPEPYELLGYCDARAGQLKLAVSAMRAAREREPRNYRYAYGLAVTQALAGQDPRAAAREALALNPLSTLTRSLERGLRSRSPARRRAVAARAQIPED